MSEDYKKRNDSQHEALSVIASCQLQCFRYLILKHYIIVFELPVTFEKLLASDCDRGSSRDRTVSRPEPRCERRCRIDGAYWREDGRAAMHSPQESSRCIRTSTKSLSTDDRVDFCSRCEHLWQDFAVDPSVCDWEERDTTRYK